MVVMMMMISVTIAVLAHGTNIMKMGKRYMKKRQGQSFKKKTRRKKMRKWDLVCLILRKNQKKQRYVLLTSNDKFLKVFCCAASLRAIAILNVQYRSRVSVLKPAG